MHQLCMSVRCSTQRVRKPDAYTKQYASQGLRVEKGARLPTMYTSGTHLVGALDIEGLERTPNCGPLGLHLASDGRHQGAPCIPSAAGKAMPRAGQGN